MNRALSGPLATRRTCGFWTLAFGFRVQGAGLECVPAWQEPFITWPGCRKLRGMWRVFRWDNDIHPDPLPPLTGSSESVPEASSSSESVPGANFAGVLHVRMPGRV